MKFRWLLLLAVVPTVAIAQTDLASVCAQRPRGNDAAPCGSFFLDAYNKAPTAPGADEHLYNAGVMFVEAKAITAAIQAFTLLRKSFPNSKLAPRALSRVSVLYGQVVMLDKAAAALEQYASMYAGEKDAYAALSDAIYYRRALGDDAKAIEDTKTFVKMFGVKKVRDAADATFALTRIYEKQGDRDATRKHLQDYIRQFGAKGGDDRLVIAHAKIGQLLWEQSCPVKPIDGDCVRVTRLRAPVCEGTRTSVERVKRDTRLVKDALAAFAVAIKTYERVGGRTQGDEGGARYYYAHALLARIDAEAEAQLASIAPRGARLEAWARAEAEAHGKLVEKYERIIDVKDIASSILAVARIARLSDHLASAIVTTATAPAECATLATAAAPARTNAVRAYSLCITKAMEWSWFDASTRGCEAALLRLAPDQFPPFRERVRATATSDALLVVDGP